MDDPWSCCAHCIKLSKTVARGENVFAENAGGYFPVYLIGRERIHLAPTLKLFMHISSFLYFLLSSGIKRLPGQRNRCRLISIPVGMLPRSQLFPCDPGLGERLHQMH